MSLGRNWVSETLLTRASIKSFTTQLPRRAWHGEHHHPYTTTPSFTDPQELPQDNLLPFSEILCLLGLIAREKQMDLGLDLRSLWTKSGHLDHTPASQMQSWSFAPWLETVFVQNHLSRHSGQNSEAQNNVQGLFVIWTMPVRTLLFLQLFRDTWNGFALLKSQLFF